MKPLAILAVSFALTLTACDRIEIIRTEVDHWVWMRRERAFQADMDRISKDTQGVYQLDYILTNEGVASFRRDEHNFHGLPHGRFDITPWLRNAGVEPVEEASAIFDPSNCTLTVIDTGSNIALIESLIEPFRPVSYRRVK